MGHGAGSCRCERLAGANRSIICLRDRFSNRGLFGPSIRIFQRAPGPEILIALRGDPATNTSTSGCFFDSPNSEDLAREPQTRYSNTT
jgi:hypothetical protein